jgi:hypothetical protein
MAEREDSLEENDDTYERGGHGIYIGGPRCREPWGKRHPYKPPLP